MARQDPQLNVRLKPSRHNVLQAAAFVCGKAPGELARELVEDGLEEYEKRPTVRKAMAARLEQAAEDEGKLARLGEESDPETG